MKAHKKLIAGIVFLVIQAISVIINGFPALDGAYGVGYLVGFLSPGIIGLIFIVAYFLSKCGK